MTTASVQDIDSFIRLQKEKLNRDKFIDYNSSQVINFLNKLKIKIFY